MHLFQGGNHQLPSVVIIGGGFGGIAAAREFARASVNVILIDRSNHSLFQPLLYQVATAALSPTDIAQPIRAMLNDQTNTSVILDEVQQINVDKREVVTEDMIFKYDYLIVAAGARHSYFGRDEWEQYAPGLKTIEDAVSICRRVLLAFEAAEKSQTDEERKAALTFVVVGAGPTGVEVAGAISELARFTLKKDFRHINPADAHVILVEASDRVLRTFSEESSKQALLSLQKLHVDVRLNKSVKNLSNDSVDIDGELIYSRTIIWAAGNKASPLAAMLGGEVTRQGCVQVNPDLSVPGHPEVFAVGDMTSATYDGGKPVPGLSPAAMQGGRHAAQNVLRMIRGEATVPWNYFDKGIMATIGRNSAVAEMGKIKIHGLIAWLAWVFVHLYFLIGFRNRFLVFVQWMWSYCTYSRGARLIPGKIGKRALIPDLHEEQASQGG